MGKKLVTFQLDDEERAALDAALAVSGMTLAEFVRTALSGLVGHYELDWPAVDRKPMDCFESRQTVGNYRRGNRR